MLATKTRLKAANVSSFISAFLTLMEVFWRLNESARTGLLLVAYHLITSIVTVSVELPLKSVDPEMDAPPAVAVTADADRITTAQTRFFMVIPFV